MTKFVIAVGIMAFFAVLIVWDSFRDKRKGAKG